MKGVLILLITLIGSAVFIAFIIFILTLSEPTNASLYYGAF